MCIGVIDHPMRRKKKAKVSVSLSLINVYSCQWPAASIHVTDKCVFDTVRSANIQSKSFFSTVFILHRGPSISSIKSSPVWYPNWFNSKFEFCTKLIQFNIQFKIILGKFNSKDYSNLDKSLLFNSIYYSIYNKLLWFNSIYYSINNYCLWFNSKDYSN